MVVRAIFALAIVILVVPHEPDLGFGRPAALSGGVTTLVTAGFEEPPWAMAQMLDALAGWPVNVGLQAGARAEDEGALEALVEAGAIGFKIHEDYGAYPELIDRLVELARSVVVERNA